VIKPEFGGKRVCVSCAARFYDMTRAPAVCPKCETVQPPEKLRVWAPSRSRVRAEPAKVTPVLVEEEAGDPLPDETEDDDAVTDDEVVDADEPDLEAEVDALR
jgi:uncharacterized protein (TIGR02300 family)